MSKTLVDERYCYVPKAGIRSGKEQEHRLNGKPVVLLEDWELEKLAVRQSMRAPGVYKVPGRRRVRGSVAMRWLGKQVGKEWAEVRSLIAKEFGGERGVDLRRYLLRMVEMETVDGRKVSEYCAYPAGFKGYGFWVDAGGVLRCNEEEGKAEQARERKEYESKRVREREGSLVVREEGVLVHKKVGGVWYEVRLEDVVEVEMVVVEYVYRGEVERYNAPRTKPSRDVLTGKVWKLGPVMCVSEEYGKGTRGKYAAKKEQLSGEELKAYGLEND